MSFLSCPESVRDAEHLISFSWEEDSKSTVGLTSKSFFQCSLCGNLAYLCQQIYDRLCYSVLSAGVHKAFDNLLQKQCIQVFHFQRRSEENIIIGIQLKNHHQQKTTTTTKKLPPPPKNYHHHQNRTFLLSYFLFSNQPKNVLSLMWQCTFVHQVNVSSGNIW